MLILNYVRTYFKNMSFKKKFFIGSSSLILFVWLRAGTPVELIVKDDLGNPVPNIKYRLRTDFRPTVFVSFEQGSAFTPKSEYIEVKTNADGIAKGEFPSTLTPWKGANGKLFYNIIPLGLSPNHYTFIQSFKPVDSKIPGGKTIARAEALMRRKLNPHLMKRGSFFINFDRRKLFQSALSNNTAIGFDMVMSDWLPPIGNGKIADCHITVNFEAPEGISRAKVIDLIFEPEHRKELAKKITVIAKYKLDFVGKGSGITPYEVARTSASPGDFWESRVTDLIPQEAPIKGYNPIIERRIEIIIGLNDFSRKELNAKYNLCHFFRIRGDDEKTNLAYYGVIKGDFFFDYYGPLDNNYIINPSTGEKNIEEGHFE